VTTYRVEQGDCLELLKSLPAGSVDAVITDPPYGIARVWKGGSGSGWGKAREQTADRNAWDATAPDLSAFLALDVPMAVWGGNYFDLPISRGWLVWNKPERNFSLSEAEIAWTNQDAPIRVCDCHRSDSGRIHPTQKPLQLMRWTLDKMNIPVGATVLDPYCGSGTTGVACVEMGINFIGFELDPDYCTIARRRIAEAVPLWTPAPTPAPIQGEMFA